MSKVVTIDPISRIDGQLRIDVNLSGGKIVDAWSSGQMYRGIEQMLIGKDPDDAWIFAQRICGSCTTANAIASVRAIENAIGLHIPLNAQLIRNLMISAQTIHDHIVHFYLLSAFDWVNLEDIQNANPQKASALAQSLSPWHRNSAHEYQAAKEKISAFLNGSQRGFLTAGHWNHMEMDLSPDIGLIIFTHYLQAIEYQRKINDCVGLLGSKTPHIQNLAVGGVANAINFDDETALNMTRLIKIKSFFEETKDFVNQAYLIDACLLGSKYLDWAQLGAGVMNYLALPEFPTSAKGTQFATKGGVIFDGKIGVAAKISSQNARYFTKNISESTYAAWYKGKHTSHPWDEITEPEFTVFDTAGKYSWIKTPRFEGKPVQVGPLAQVLTSFALGDTKTMEQITAAIELIKSVSGKKISLANLHSTIGRHVARAIKTSVVNEMALSHWDALMTNLGNGDFDYINRPEYPVGESRGVGCHESSKGLLSHWVVLENKKIKNYQVITPSTWNLSPRDENGLRSPLEASLIGNPIQDEGTPLEAIRTIHSFAPCETCAAH